MRAEWEWPFQWATPSVREKTPRSSLSAVSMQNFTRLLSGFAFNAMQSAPDGEDEGRDDAHHPDELGDPGPHQVRRGLRLRRAVDLGLLDLVVLVLVGPGGPAVSWPRG